MLVLEHEIWVLVLLIALLCYAVRTKSAERLAMWLTRQCSKINEDVLWYGLILLPFFIFEASIRGVFIVD